MDDSKGYISQWEAVVVRYYWLFNYCTLYILMLVFDQKFPSHSILFVLIQIVMFILILANQLFTLLLREVHD